jgi:hypothetical protein
MSAHVSSGAAPISIPEALEYDESSRRATSWVTLSGSPRSGQLYEELGEVHLRGPCVIESRSTSTGRRADEAS